MTTNKETRTAVEVNISFNNGEVSIFCQMAFNVRTSHIPPPSTIKFVYRPEMDTVLFSGRAGKFNRKYDFIIYSSNEFGNFKKEVGEKCQNRLLNK